ncbi:outer membrane beta-barrel protein [Microbulbifer yueqingensis]|uniref:Opacity protein n=1 Tax=Microbulbifer yueqingensis TaxID=658219 RepID=A0A1G9DDN4_9GAMM|nr:outer membrane beta-barrel protein [Microbulbifer yueqingensis]SDK61917.1 Opacity protein [Microbulbifer yueqingensis]
MKKVTFVAALLCASPALAIEWNNPFVGICAGEYQVVGTIGAGAGELQVNKDRDGFAYASVGLTPTVGVWQTELRYSYFDDGGVSSDLYGLNFKVDFSLDCDIQCLYWMAGWTYGEFDVDTIDIDNNQVTLLVEEDGNDDFWHAGVGYRYRWTRNFDTSVEYMYNDVGDVVDFDLGHLRSLTLNFSYRFFGPQ